MVQRESVPPVGGGHRLVASWDPFVAVDIPQLLSEARPPRPSGHARPTNRCAELARLLSLAAIDWMQHRLTPPADQAADVVARLDRIAKLAEELQALLQVGAATDFRSDIGHAQTVRDAARLGPVRQFEAPMMKAPGVRDYRGDLAAQAQAEWSETKEFARGIRAHWEVTLPEDLAILAVAAKHEAAERRAVKRPRGPRAQSERHRFVLAVGRVYSEATGRPLGISNPSGEGVRGGPAPRFLCAVCRLLMSRLTDQELDRDPELRTVLSAVTEAAAAQWIAEAKAQPPE